MNNNIMASRFQPGIYKITNTANGKCYIGQSKYLAMRISSHKWELKKGIHINEHLQRAFNKYGDRKFAFDIIEECNVDEMDDKEIFWIDFFDSTNRNLGYNLESGGNQFKTHHPETRKKMAISARGKNSILTEDEVAIIKQSLLDGVGQYDLADEYGVHVSAISRISCLDNWSYVAPHLNERLKNLRATKKAELERKIKMLHEKGWNNSQIMKHLGCTGRAISTVVQSNYTTRNEEVRDGCREDFINNVPVAETLKKYDIKRCTYSNHVRDLRHAREKELHDKIHEMKAQGYLNKDIAEELNIHRTTVTQHLKGRTKGERRKAVKSTPELESKVMDMVKQGKSLNSIGITLEVSRAYIDRVISDHSVSEGG